MSGSVVISVGDELLAGRIVDGNAAWLSEQLACCGFPVLARETVPDDEQAIGGALRRGLARAPVVVVGGGLGPTADDRTREGIAHGLGVAVERNEEALGLIRAFFERHGRELPEREHGQASLPLGARPLANARGTAPGLVVEAGERLVVALPGVPRELRAMFSEGVAPLLAVRSDRGPVPVTRDVTVVGLPESVIGQRLGDLLGPGRNPSLGSYPQTSQVVLTASARADDADQAGRMLDELEAEVTRRLAGHVAGTGRLDLAAEVGRLLEARGLSLAVAESLTGGHLADRLVSQPGISSVFQAGIICYSDASKQALLGVRAETLAEHGAVSAACAEEMAVGALTACAADLAVATTGIAGPAGGTVQKPVGTVWLGFATRGGREATHRLMVGDRRQIRERTAQWALERLWRHMVEA